MKTKCFGGVLCALVMCYSWHASAGFSLQVEPGELSCRLTESLTKLPELSEASGLTLSRSHPGLLWSHNDSGAPVLFAVTTGGAIKSKVTVAGAHVEDWEDIAAGPCPQGSCLYIGDIGDNNPSRQRITVYRLKEPAPAEGTTRAVEAFHATYPDGPRDAEAMFVASNDIFILTKDPPATLYRFPQKLQPDGTGQLQRIASFDDTFRKERVTGAAASPDGQWVVLRTHKTVIFYRLSRLTSGHVGEGLRFDVGPLNEPQGEGVALASDGTVYLAGEGGGAGGTLGRITCTLPGSVHIAELLSRL
jgi:hypothetical protein